MENRGKNKEFIRAAVLMILSKNYDIIINDTHEIDTSISISENIAILLDKYTLKIPIHEIDY
jgi:hypothetical protein